MVNPPNLPTQNLFQLIGPEDYTPDYAAEPQRKDKCTLVRTVGGFLVSGLLPATAPSVVEPTFKAALFVAGDKAVEDGFANDPGQFNIINAAQFPTFCRDFAPMHVFWSTYYNLSRNTTGGAAAAAEPQWVPPAESPRREWDVTVKRSLQGDDALFLLINTIFLQNPEDEFGGGIEVESRNLIMDQ